MENEQTDRLAAVAKGQHEQAGAAVLAALGAADHGAGAVINLRFFSRRGHDHRVGFRHVDSPVSTDETLDAEA